MDNNYYYGNNVYGGAYPGYVQPGGMYANPVMYNPVNVPQNQPTLTVEEAKQLQQAVPNKLDITIEPLDNVRAICNHKDPATRQDRVLEIADGSGDVWCQVCKYRWDPTPATKEQVKEDIDRVISHMQNAKWVGDFGNELVRSYFPMIPLLEKFPDLYEYAMSKFNNYLNANGIQTADAGVYQQFSNLMGYPNPAYTYGNYPQYGAAPAYGQPQMYPYGQPAPNGQVYQQPVVQGQPATNVNPMQATGFPAQPAQAYPTQPMYGQPVAPAYGQPQMYPNGQPVYGQPQVAPAMGTAGPVPGVGAPITNMPNASTAGQQQAYQPAAAQAQQQNTAPAQTTTVTNNGDGTQTSETKVKL